MKRPGFKLNGFVVFVFVFCLSFSQIGFAAVIRVMPTGSDANSGENWSLAKQTITGALSAAGSGDEIWVAAGVYQEHIVMKNGVDVYGGLAGTEENRDQRDWALNESILDGTDSGIVVTITGMDAEDTRLDGFTVTAGHGINGGGIIIVASAPVITNNTIKLNLSEGYGAGISINGFNPISASQPVITNNTIVDNYASELEGDGAGIVVINSSPEISGNIIARNQAAQNGGGICCWKNSLPKIANNIIVANSSCFLEIVNTGSGTSRPSVGGGGIFASATDLDGTPIENAVSAPLIINNVIAANGGYLGGGICVVDSILDAATITNNTIVANNGSGIFWQNTSPRINNNIVSYNTWGLEQIENLFTTPTITANCVYGNVLQKRPSDFKGLDDPTGTNGNISMDPLFANYAIGEFHIQPGSPCIGSGSVAAVGNGWTDIDGQERIMDGGVDMGADESDGTVWSVPMPVIHVKPDGDDANNGLTWTSAKQTIAGGIFAASQTGGEIWVAAGTYPENIVLPAFVYLYGGFSGIETSRGERDWASNTTVFDGSLSGRVVTSTNSGYLVSTIDGFIVENGRLGTLGGGDYGGGIFCRVTGPVIANNLIQNNSVGRVLTGDLAHGGAIACFLSYAVISDNTISGNTVENTFDGAGGGIYSYRSMPLIEKNSISANHAKMGPAIYCFGAFPVILNNVIRENDWHHDIPPRFGSTHGAVTLWLCDDFLLEKNIISENVAAIGAGIRAESCFAGSIRNNLVINNTAYDYSAYTGGLGGGIYCEIPQEARADFYIANNTISGNQATHSIFGEQGGGVALTILADKLILANNIMAFNSSGIWLHPTSPYAPMLKNNDVFNAANNYVNLSAGATDISQDPRFVDLDGADDNPATSEDNDYHLAENSPCVDAGDNTILGLLLTDFEDDPRIIDGNNDGTATVDIGADEFVNQCDGDVEPDGDVDGSDLNVFSVAYTVGDPAADLDNSGAVDANDLAIIAASFGRSGCPILP